MIADCRLQVAGCRLWIADGSTMLTTSFGMRIMDCGMLQIFSPSGFICYKSSPIAAYSPNYNQRIHSLTGR